MSVFESLFHPPTKATFAKLLARELRAVGDTRTSRFDAKNFRLRFIQGGQDVGFANLHNFYAEYSQRTGSERRVYLKQAVRSLLSPHKQLPVEFADAQPDLLLTVRNRASFTSLELHAWLDGEEDFNVVHLPFAEHLAIGIVYDLPESMVMLQQRQLDEWNATFYEAYEFAFANLMEFEATFSSFDDHLYVADTTDNFDATRILMTEWICDLDLAGYPIAMIPNRDKLLIAGSEDVRGVQMMARMAREALSHPRPLTGFAFRLQNDEWMPWLPPGDHPSFAALYELRTQTLFDEYAHQKRLLDQVHGRDDSHISVEAYNTFHRRNHKYLVSCCTWQADAECLLPKTNYILFRQNDASTTSPPVYGRFHRVQSVAGHLMHLEDLYPVRYRVTGFPNPQQLAEIQADDELIF